MLRNGYLHSIEIATNLTMNLLSLLLIVQFLFDIREISSFHEATDMVSNDPKFIICNFILILGYITINTLVVTAIYLTNKTHPVHPLIRILYWLQSVLIFLSSIWFYYYTAGAVVDLVL